MSTKYIQVPEELIFNPNINYSYIRVLHALAFKYCYYKENRLNKYSTDGLANDLGVSRRWIQKAIAYLKENGLIITKRNVEYINPMYCYQSLPETREDNIAHILEDHIKFHGVQPAKEEDAEQYYKDYPLSDIW